LGIDNTAIITYVQLLKEDLVIMRLVPKNGIMPEYKTGQFITMGFPIPSEDFKIVRRAYSMASHAENRKYIELLVRWVRQPLPGRVTTMLFGASEGDEVSWLKPMGNDLLINEVMHDGKKDVRRIVCVGGGTPIEYEEVLRGFDKFHIVFVATTADYFLLSHDRIRKSMEKNKGGTMILDISNPRAVDDSVTSFPGVKLMLRDQISELYEENEQARAAIVPDVRKMITKETPILEATIKI